LRAAERTEAPASGISTDLVPRLPSLSDMVARPSSGRRQ